MYAYNDRVRFPFRFVCLAQNGSIVGFSPPSPTHTLETTTTMLMIIIALASPRFVMYAFVTPKHQACLTFAYVHEKRKRTDCCLLMLLLLFTTLITYLEDLYEEIKRLWKAFNRTTRVKAGVAVKLVKRTYLHSTQE